ncbi:exported hypothetical protein [uncultured Eubacteriales bacterium]|uniref:Secreted protein n=1 Tax=uncultured Eubacteriales bacterium TaxID=172733 RepID=A0A212K3F5_9FIRM|nr:exported hypothetical protein [uncultured Eubacteriales bacterium]
MPFIKPSLAILLVVRPVGAMPSSCPIIHFFDFPTNNIPRFIKVFPDLYVAISQNVLCTILLQQPGSVSRGVFGDKTCFCMFSRAFC